MCQRWEEAGEGELSLGQKEIEVRHLGAAAGANTMCPLC